MSLRGDGFEGRLFALDQPHMTSDDLILGEIVGHHASASLEHCYLLQRVRHAAAGEERLRLARDLRDGLLQSLTGAALQLQTVGRLRPPWSTTFTWSFTKSW